MSNHLFDNLLKRYLGDERPFLHLADGSSWSYAKVLDLSGCIANALVAAGVSPGDRVAVQVEKSPEALALYFACVRAGAVFLPLNTAYTSGELSYFLGDARPAILVCDAARLHQLADIAAENKTRLFTLLENGSGTLSDFAAEFGAEFSTVPRTANDLAAILYTSGTTGRSKGSMLSHDNLLSNACTLVDYWQFSDSDTLLHALPIFHTHGLFVAINITLAAGGSIIFLPRFNVDEIIRLMPQATTMMGVPTFYTRLLASEDFNRRLVQHMRLFVSGSAPLLAETHSSFEARTGHRILERYGMTETNMNTSNPYEGERRAGTVGFPLPGVEVRVCHAETGEAVPQGDIGTLEVRGPNVFQGYWEMPEKTAEELRENGFFITGDLGYIDDDGYVHIVGRGKDLIISGGLNIYPKEVESKIDEIAGVVESAVIGVPHADFGEGVVAVVVPESNTSLTEASIVDALGNQLARFKQPKRVLFVEQLPRNTMGKVQKNILRDEYAELLTSAG